MDTVGNYHKTFKNYTTYIDHLGEGSSGNVDLHKINDTGEQVAIKTVKSNRGHIDATVIKELQCMQVLYTCPYIIKLLDVNIFEHHNTMILQIMMPYYRYDLENYMKDHDTRKRIMYFDSIADNMLHALNNLYYRGIIHSDIKPGNILIDASSGEPVAYLADFGLATQLPCESTIRNVFLGIRGSPIYLAPEMLMEKHYFNEKVDMWSMGITLLVYLVNNEFTYPEDYLLMNYPDIESILYKILSLLKTPLPDTYTNYNNAKENKIHDTIGVSNILNIYIPKDVKLVTKEQITLLSSMLQFNADDRLSAYDVNHKVCPRVKEGLLRGKLHSMDLTQFYKNVFKIIYVSRANGLEYTTCYAAICLMERYASNFEVKDAILLAAACIMLMAEFYEYEYLTEQSLNTFFQTKFTFNTLNQMQLDILKKANYIITYCDMDPVLHVFAEKKYKNLKALHAMEVVYGKLRDNNVYLGDLSNDEIAMLF